MEDKEQEGWGRGFKRDIENGQLRVLISYDPAAIAPFGLELVHVPVTDVKSIENGYQFMCQKQKLNQ